MRITMTSNEARSGKLGGVDYAIFDMDGLLSAFLNIGDIDTGAEQVQCKLLLLMASAGTCMLTCCRTVILK